MGKGGPCCSSCGTHSCLFAKGALAVCPRWLVAPRRRTLPAQRLIHTANCTFALFFACSLHASPRACSPCNSHSFLIYRLPSPSPSMFLHTGKINHLIGTPSAEISCSRGRRFGSLVMTGRGEDEPTCNCKLNCLGNVYLHIPCHTFLGCCCFALLGYRMVLL